MQIINFKKAIQVLGYDLEKYTKGYNYRSAFATEKATGKLYYFLIIDLRDNEPKLMYRTAESTKDYHGGTNRWDMKDKLEALGYKVKEPRKACDYNGM